MNVYFDGGLTLTAFFAALGFSHARDETRPIIEWMILFTTAVLVAAVVVVFLAHVAVPVLNPYPLSISERVKLENGSAVLKINMSRPLEPEYGHPYSPPSDYFLAAALFFGIFPTLGYAAGYAAGAKITGFHVEWIEYLTRGEKHELVLHISPRVEPRSGEREEVVSLAEALGED